MEVYNIVSVPAATPVIVAVDGNPPLETTVASEVLLLDQVPPKVLSVMVKVFPTQTLVTAAVMALTVGLALTVTFLVEEPLQP